jgi:hypothetical protein
LVACPEADDTAVADELTADDCDGSGGGSMVENYSDDSRTDKNLSRVTTNKPGRHRSLEIIMGDKVLIFKTETAP